MAFVKLETDSADDSAAIEAKGSLKGNFVPLETAVKDTERTFPKIDVTSYKDPVGQFFKGMGAEVTPQMEQQSPYLSAIAETLQLRGFKSPVDENKYPALAAAKKTAEDIVTVPANYLNQFSFNIARRAGKKLGYDYPSETDNPVAQVGNKIAGVVGMVQNPINRLLSSGGGLKGAGEGALQATAYSWEPGQKPLETAGIAAGGAVVGAVAPVVIKKVFDKKSYAEAADWFRETFPGLSREFPVAVKKFGVDKIFDKSKASATYVYDELVPKARDYLLRTIAKKKPEVRDVLSNLGYSTGEIDAVERIAPAKLAILRKPFKSTDAMLQHVDDLMSAQKKSLTKILSTAEKKGKELRLNKLDYYVNGVLQKEGLVDMQGQLTGRVQDPMLPEGLRNMVELKQSLDSSGKVIGMNWKRYNVRDYLKFRDGLQEKITNSKFKYGMKIDSDNPANRFLYQADDILAQEVGSQLPGLSKAQNEYGQLASLRKLAPDLFKDNMGNIKFGETLKGIGKSDNPMLHDVWSEAIGRGNVEDLQAWRFADEFYNKGKASGGGRKFAMVESLSRPMYETISRRAESMRSPESLTGKLRGAVEGVKSSKLGSAIGQAVSEGAPTLLAKTNLTSEEGRKLVTGKEGFARISDVPAEVQNAFKTLQAGVGKVGITNKNIIAAKRTLNSQGYKIINGKLTKVIGLAGIATAGALAVGEANAMGNRPPKTEGIASTYGWGEKLNEKTASGEKFDPDALTAASYEYPLGAKVKVTDTKTGNSVIVTINDRGPHKRLGRLIDLSKGAWKALGKDKAGLTNVKVELVNNKGGSK